MQHSIRINRYRYNQVLPGLAGSLFACVCTVRQCALNIAIFIPFSLYSLSHSTVRSFVCLWIETYFSFHLLLSTYGPRGYAAAYNRLLLSMRVKQQKYRVSAHLHLTVFLRLDLAPWWMISCIFIALKEESQSHLNGDQVVI